MVPEGGPNNVGIMEGRIDNDVRIPRLHRRIVRQRAKSVSIRKAIRRYLTQLTFT